MSLSEAAIEVLREPFRAVVPGCIVASAGLPGHQRSPLGIDCAECAAAGFPGNDKQTTSDAMRCRHHFRPGDCRLSQHLCLADRRPLSMLIHDDLGATVPGHRPCPRRLSRCPMR